MFGGDAFEVEVEGLDVLHTRLALFFTALDWKLIYKGQYTNLREHLIGSKTVRTGLARNLCWHISLWRGHLSGADAYQICFPRPAFAEQPGRTNAAFESAGSLQQIQPHCLPHGTQQLLWNSEKPEQVVRRAPWALEDLQS